MEANRRPFPKKNLKNENSVANFLHNLESQNGLANFADYLKTPKSFDIIQMVSNSFQNSIKLENVMNASQVIWKK